VDPLPDPHRLCAAQPLLPRHLAQPPAHHFKNEHFWHGVTNKLSDRVLGTDPDQREVPRSETARTLAG
jgi:hypothetical protein